MQWIIPHVAVLPYIITAPFSLGAAHVRDEVLVAL